MSRSTPLRVAMEGIVLILVALSPWGFSGVAPLVERAIFTGIALLLVLWALDRLSAARPLRSPCLVVVCLGALFLLGVWQTTPLSPRTLSFVSPATAELYSWLLPEGEGSTISIAPGATLAFLVRLLAVAALIAVVRDSIASPESIRRFAVVALVNGFLLALVGLLQFFSSPRNMVYWTFPSAAQVFGPMNRNDFAGYVNVCIGLGIGLFLAARMKATRRREDTTPLWIGSALVFMLTALTLCLSRGGLVCLVAAVALVTLVTRSGKSTVWVGLVLCLGLGLAAWFGLDESQARFATLWKSDSPGEDRWRVWTQTAPYAVTFPMWGSGYGTFGFLEQMSRRSGLGPDFYYDHAHNMYLELLLEGGFVALIVGLAAVALSLFRAWHACHLHRGRTLGAWALGGFIALVTVVLHSFVDFTLHLPAISVLAAVLIGQLSALGEPLKDEPLVRTATGMLGAILSAVGLLAVAWILWNAAVTREQVDRYRRAAQRASENRTHQAEYWQAVIDLMPNDADAWQNLGEVKYQTPGRDLREAESCFLKARALAPASERSHIALAALAGQAIGTESVATHLDRVRRLVPYNARAWFQCGLQELQDGEKTTAWSSWKRSLTCSPDHLEEIVSRALKHLTSHQLIDQILPDDGELLFRATGLVEDKEQRQPLQKRLIEHLQASKTLSDEQMLRLARALIDLQREDEALAAYERLANRRARGVEWRYEYAMCLYEQKKWKEAVEILKDLFRIQPDHAQGHELERLVQRRISEGDE